MVAVLFSSGVDSWVHLHWAIEVFGINVVQPVYFDVDQRYAEREFEAGWHLCAELGLSLMRRSIHGLYEDERGYVPLRNLRFILETTTWPDCQGVVFGMLKGEYSPDKNPRFVRELQKLLDSQFAASMYQQRRKFVIYTPFEHRTKGEMLDWYLDRVKRSKDAMAALRLTQACYSPEGHCGECQSCLNRWIAFTVNGVQENPYVVHPAEAFLNKLAQMGRKGMGEAFWNRQALHRVGWALEALAAVTEYTKATYNCGAFAEIYRRRQLL